MIITKTNITGAYLVKFEISCDKRGSFSRVYCEDSFVAHGLHTCWPQWNESFNHRYGTLRGLHWQKEPYGEIKLVRCVTGKIFDVLVDLRPDSPSFQRWQSFTLSAHSAEILYIPAGIAHGFQTLEDNTTLLYHMSIAHRPEAAAGLRWNDTTLAISWPISEPILSSRDAGLPFLEERGW